MKNSKGTKRLVSGIPRANDGCQHFAFCIFHFSELISEPRVNQKRAFAWLADFPRMAMPICG
jgi:hypothetical protein